MANVLSDIIANKADHIEVLKQRYPEQSLRPHYSGRSFYQALKGGDTGFILECKKASPSKGMIRAAFDIEAIAEVYKKYASAISVLTDETYFRGDFAFIPKVRARVSQPVICKDFFIDHYQVKLAAHMTADAILLMLSVLSDDQYQALAIVAKNYQLDVLTEVSNERELDRAIALKAEIIGINNRDLRDLSTNLGITEELAANVPEEHVIISESGIYTREQVCRLSPLVDGFLVGSSLMAEENLDLACRKLILGD